MNVLRDYYCVECGEEQHDVVGDVIAELACSQCRRVTDHRDTCRCRGKRYHWNDWGTVPLEEMARFVGVGANEGDGSGHADHAKPMRDVRTGRVYNDDPKYSTEARAEKTARRMHARERRAGRGRIYGPTSGLAKANHG